MIGDYLIVMKDDLDHVRKLIMLSINFINFKRKLQMKTIATLIATLVATAAFATEPAKTAAPAAATATPAAATATPAATPAAATPAKKVEKKVEHKKADHKKAEVTPVKSEAPAASATTKAVEPAKK